MSIKHLTTILFVAATLTASADVTFNFDDQTTFDEQWPNQVEFRTGSTVSLESSPARVSLLADVSGGSTPTAAISTAASFSSELDFVSEAKTFTFSNVNFSMNGGGTSYIGALGVANSSNPDLLSASGGVSDAVYLQFFRSSNELQLVQKTNQTNKVVLATFDVNGYDYSTLSLTLTGTTWEVSGTASNSNTISGSGLLDSEINAGNWGSDFHIALQSRSGYNFAIEGRNAILSVEEVSATAIPEASECALFLGVIIGHIIAFRRFRKRA